MIIATKIRPDFSIEKRFGGIVAGIDEAGRGCLSGPLVACCIIISEKSLPEGISDSKALSFKKREEIFLQLLKTSKFGVGIVNEKIIDRINILNATKLAMKIAFDNLCNKINNKPKIVIVDGNFTPQIDCKTKSIIKGDQKSLSIAVASIIAKQTRDKTMIELDKEFPCYGWLRNKGYGTKDHFLAITKFGTSPHHRQSFNLKKNYVDD